MAKKSNDISFEQDDFILNYRPQISFIEPAQETSDFIPEPEEILTDDIKNQTDELVAGLHTANALVKATQQRIDNRVQSLGGVVVKLDPIKDHTIIAAMKRRFPNKEDPTQITYDDYKSVLGCVRDNAISPPSISVEDIRDAAQDPYRMDFGSLATSSAMETITPIDLEEYQKNAVLAIFSMMLPLLKNLLNPF